MALTLVRILVKVERTRRAAIKSQGRRTVYQTWAGPVSLTARVDSVDLMAVEGSAGTAARARLSVMIRQDSACATRADPHAAGSALKARSVAR